MVRNNKAIVVLALLGVVLRVGVALAYRPALALYGDSFAYLGNARHLVPGPIHPLGYAVVLRVLDVTGSFATVTVLQHALVMALGIGTYVVLKRLGVRSWLAASAAAPALLDAYQANVEQFLLAEVTFEVFLLTGLAALVVAGQRASVAAAGGLLLALATVNRVVGLFVIVVAGLWLIVRRVGWRPILAFAAAAAIPLLGYAAWFDSANGQFALGGNSARFLWAKVAPIADCPGDGMPAKLSWLCLPQPVGQRPNTEFLDWNAQSPYFTHHADVATKDAQAHEFTTRVIAHQPARYARLVARDVAHYFRWTRTTDYIDWHVQTWWYLDTLDPARWHAGIVTDPPARARYRKPLPDHQSAHWPSSWLRAYQRVGFVPGPLLALFGLLGVAGAIWGRARVDRSVWSGGLLLGVVGFTLLVQPAATVPLDYRYLLPAMLVFAPAGALGLEALVSARRGRVLADGG